MADWERIVGQHSGIVWQTAWRLLRNEPEAADCYQDTFLSAIQIANRQTVWNWPALLRRLATNHALTRLRRRQSGGTILDSVDLAKLSAAQPDPLQQAESTELSERLDAALASLPLDEAEVLCLRFFSDMTYGQIGRQLNRSPNAVGVLLHRARREIGRLLCSKRDRETRCCHE